MAALLPISLANNVVGVVAVVPSGSVVHVRFDIWDRSAAVFDLLDLDFHLGAAKVDGVLRPR